MALTPEDVVKKEFTKPKGFGRSGYDEIQVDDFLDEIVVELRRLNSENEDLTGKLEDCRRSKGMPGKETSSPAASVVPAATPAKAGADATQKVPVGVAKNDASSKTSNDAALAKAREELATAQRDLASAKGEREKVEREVAQAKERLATLQKEIEQAEADADKRSTAALKRAEDAEAKVGAQRSAATAASGNDAAGVIALAQRLHDEHVHEGETTRTRLISEGQQQHDSMVGDGTKKRDDLIKQGQTKHDQLVGTGQNRHDALMRQANERSTGLVKEAEERKNRILGQLTTERESISSKIEQLKTFEHEYRSKLKGFIEGQLKDLNSSDSQGVKN